MEGLIRALQHYAIWRFEDLIMNGFYSLIYFSSWGRLTKTPHVRINITLKLNLVALKKCYLNNISMAFKTSPHRSNPAVMMSSLGPCSSNMEKLSIWTSWASEAGSDWPSVSSETTTQILGGCACWTLASLPEPLIIAIFVKDYRSFI